MRGASPYLEKSPILMCISKELFYMVILLQCSLLNGVVPVLLNRQLTVHWRKASPSSNRASPPPSHGSLLRSFVKSQSERTTSNSQNILQFMQISHRRIGHSVYIFNPAARRKYREREEMWACARMRASPCVFVCERSAPWSACAHVVRNAFEHLHCQAAAAVSWITVSFGDEAFVD